MTIALRRVTADDWERWRSVRLAALTEAPDAFGSTLDDWADAPEHRWRARLSIPGALDLLAYAGPAAVGMASGVPGDEPGTVELISMWVDPAHRGRGVATDLIGAVAQWARASGAQSLDLSVMPDNDAARQTYERNGFVAADEPGDALPDGRYEVVMRRALTAERGHQQEAGTP